MPKGVGIDVRQVVSLGEFAEPCGDGVRDHRRAVFLYEKIVGVLPPVPHFEPKLHICASVFPQQSHRFNRQFDVANGAGCFCRALVDSALGAVEKICVDFDLILLKIHPAPPKSHDLAAAAACDQQQMRDDLPFERLLLQRLADAEHLLRLEVLNLLLPRLWRRRLRCGVVGNEHFLLGL